MVIKVVKLIDSNHHIYENKPFGPVDVRTLESETNEEKNAAFESLTSFNYASDGKNILRLVSIFISETPKDAIADSELLFEETMDLLKRQILAKIKNCDGAGYWVNMDNGETTPFIKQKVERDIIGYIHQISLGPYSPMFTEQMISSMRGIEVNESYIRSIHWYNESNLQNRLYLKFLYKWIAIETIAKTNNDDDIVPKLCLVLGFPLSKSSKSIPRHIAEKLKSINGHKHYKNVIENEINQCKKIRNSIVHSGFKETDLTNKNMELKLYIINSAYNRMVSNIEKAIISGKNTLVEVWDIMCEQISQDDKLTTWISGVFLDQIKQYKGI
jgi:hypothetical protein